MSIKKAYPKNKRTCKVTFDVPMPAENGVKKVHVVGEFNNWSTSATPMRRQKNGAFRVTLELSKGHEYQFRYLLDNERWLNEAEADKFAETPFGDAQNSVIVI